MLLDQNSTPELEPANEYVFERRSEPTTTDESSSPRMEMESVIGNNMIAVHEDVIDGRDMEHRAGLMESTGRIADQRRFLNSTSCNINELGMDKAAVLDILETQILQPFDPDSIAIPGNANTELISNPLSLHLSAAKYPLIAAHQVSHILEKLAQILGTQPAIPLIPSPKPNLRTVRKSYTQDTSLKPKITSLNKINSKPLTKSSLTISSHRNLPISTRHTKPHPKTRLGAKAIPNSPKSNLKTSSTPTHEITPRLPRPHLGS